MAKRRAPFYKAKSAEQLRDALAKRKRQKLIDEHRQAIKGVEGMRRTMGDEWADNTIAYRRRKLRELGAR